MNARWQLRILSDLGEGEKELGSWKDEKKMSGRIKKYSRSTKGQRQPKSGELGGETLFAYAVVIQTARQVRRASFQGDTPHRDTG